tara:strand:- start:32946 stop:33998 length:1053 start_codon:yes stop_codon:yes gene_type:complete
MRLFTIILALCALTVVALTTQVHAVGMPMMYSVTPQDQANKTLATLIAQSLREDSTGQGMIDGSECTTPNDFFNAIREYHPGAALGSVMELPIYLESLQLRSAPEGEFQMSRILVNVSAKDNGRSCSLDLNGWNRAFRGGESMWFDVNLGMPILAGDCSNVVGKSITPLKPDPARGQSVSKELSIEQHGLVEVEDPFKYVVYTFLPEGPAKLFLRLGDEHQSRNMAEELNARTDELQYPNRCIPITIDLYGTAPAEDYVFSSKGNSVKPRAVSFKGMAGFRFSFEACNGRGELSLPREFLGHMFWSMTSATGLIYPKSGRLPTEAGDPSEVGAMVRDGEHYTEQYLVVSD